MNTTRDWIDLIRSTALFNPNTPPENEQHPLINPYEVRFTQGKKAAKILSIPQVTPVSMYGVPAYHHITNPWSVGSWIEPSAPDPALAQSADQITMLWAKDTKAVRYPFDEEAGVFAPAGAKVMYADGNNRVGDFQALDPVPHRTDGYPAILVIGGLKKWCNQGQLHRKGNRPALKADYVGAIWMQDGKPYRHNGPTHVLIEDYAEYHTNGVYQGYRSKKVLETWANANLSQPSGTVNPLSNRYFSDPQDEVVCIAEMIA